MYIGSLPAASNRATYTQAFQLYDNEDSEGVTLEDATITVELRKPGCTSPELSAEIGDGVTVTDEDEGQFELQFTVTQMRNLCAMQYEIGIVIEQDDETVQYIAGTLPVIDGIVT
jgi:hypothetical protein